MRNPKGGDGLEKEICIFKRMEKKYRMTAVQRDALLTDIGMHLVPDAHGRSTVCSIYLDTSDHLLIRNSIDARTYKEKLRLRSYGLPGEDDHVFLEIKKKYKGVVYKRRVSMTAREAITYVEKGEKPYTSQIFSELDYAMRFYRYPKPAMLIACERDAFFVKDDPRVRLTFDTDIRFKETSTYPTDTKGTAILPPETVMMEVKTEGAMPLWLARTLSEHRLYPASFSKYGTAYQMVTEGRK